MKNVVTLGFIVAVVFAILPVGPVEAGTAGGGNVAWTQWSFDDGILVKSGPDWIEYQRGQVFARFRETNRTAQYVYLYDDSRDMTVRLSATQMHWRTPDNDVWNDLRQGWAK